MLTLVSFFLVALIASATAIWLYRKISGWQGFTRVVVGRSQSTDRMKIELQQGFISLVSSPREQVKNVKLHSPRGGIKTPWGW